MEYHIPTEQFWLTNVTKHRCHTKVILHLSSWWIGFLFHWPVLGWSCWACSWFWVQQDGSVAFIWACAWYGSAGSGSIYKDDGWGEGKNWLCNIEDETYDSFTWACQWSHRWSQKEQEDTHKCFVKPGSFISVNSSLGKMSIVWMRTWMNSRGCGWK
jgi:hypothetical protein